MVSSFYLPGAAPNEYTDGEAVPLYVNSLTPMSSQQVKSIVSYDFYDERFHFCMPDSAPEKQAESLGSILFGDRILTSAFKVKQKTPRLSIPPTHFLCCPLAKNEGRYGVRTAVSNANSNS